ncbi:MAG: hypothetical protein FWE88_06980 [Phycisphaerae bacterium]|nr:hypothetical protein [Phycisphaerae bacterium]
MPDNLLVSEVRDKALQAHLANGHVGLQGSSSGLAPARSFMVGISDLTPNDHYRMACLPAWNGVAVRVGGDTLEDAFGRGDVDGYRQTLDIGTARLVTEYRAGVGGVALRVRVETWLSRADRFLACQRVTLSADRTAKVGVSVGICPWPAPTERYPFRSLVWPHPDYPKDFECGFYNKRMSYAWRPGHMDVVRTLARPADACWAVSAVAAGNGPAVGVAVAARAAGTPARGDVETAGEYELSLGTEPTTVELYAAFSRDGLADGLAETAIRRAVAARARGLDALWADHAAVWAELWRGDILVEGDDTIARQARADLFQLYQNQPVDDRYPMQIMGIASPGYYGGCFWDCDVYTLPALLPFGPERTLGTLHFRKRTLSTAMRNATRDGLRGARYSGISELVEGEENCLGHSAMARGEIHISAAVAIGAWNTYCATGDRSLLRADAWPVLEAVADYFASRVTWVPWENRYELLHVYSAVEHLGNVHNCLYTNAAVKKALRIAARAAERCGFAPDPAWTTVAERLHLPFNRATGLFQGNSGSDKPCEHRWLETSSYFLADLPATPAQLADAISVPPIHWDMSYHAAIAAQAGDARRMRAYLDHQATNFSKPESFLQRTEIAGNDAGPYLTGCGTMLQNLLLGAGGLRWTEAGLTPTFAPCLPEGIRRIDFPRLSWHGTERSASITPSRGIVFDSLA